MSNVRLAQSVLEEAWRLGAREIVLCAGARNAPFVSVLSAAKSPFRVYSFFEERSAGFFALGRMQSTRRPVAVITTSGTAAAELLPACIEADYQRLPLLMITADRPKRYRGSGAPQTIEQPGLYSHYAGASFDIEGRFEAAQVDCRRPVHWNICFDEPLIDGEAAPWNLREDAGDIQSATGLPEIRARKPLVVVGGLPPSEAQQFVPILKSWGRPLYIEALSQLRGHPELASLEIQAGEKTLKHLKYDGVILVGQVPTVRLWRDLENNDLPVTCFSHTPFSGLPRAREVFPLSAAQNICPAFEVWSESEKERDRELAASRAPLFEKYPLSEPAWMAWLSRAIPQEARVFLGNSLPIREWDFAAAGGSARDIYANRGTNGIDGLISTFAGAAHESRPNWCVLGDLSAMYDLSGPWAVGQRKLKSFNLAVINNSGGQIFHRLFRNPLFLNSHQLNFKGWAEMWNLKYTRLQNERAPLTDGRQVVEIVPDNAQSEAFWKEWEAL